jgi:hypothetical protein
VLVRIITNIKSSEYTVDVQVIRIFSSAKIKYAYVSFNKISDCIFVFNLLINKSNTSNLITSEERKIDKKMCVVNSASSVRSFSSYGLSDNISQGHSQNVFYCYDLTDCKKSYWYAVVLRNLDVNCNTEKIKEFCGMITKGVLYCTKPEKVLDSICAIVVIEDLDDAEKLCIYINNQDRLGSTKETRLKVNFIFISKLISG